MAINFGRLLATLNSSKIAASNNALYQTINNLIKTLQEIEGNLNRLAQVIEDLDELELNVEALDELVASLFGATFITSTDVSALLVNSRELLAGTNVTFDDTVPNERTINVSVVAPDQLSPFLLMGG